MANNEGTPSANDALTLPQTTEPPESGQAPETHEPDLASFNLSLYKNAFEEFRQFIYCKVCIRPMYEPYTVACGHTFCYSCLHQWFDSHSNSRTCPDCRATVHKKPAPSYVVREIVRLFITRTEILPEDEDSETHKQAREEEAQQVEKDRIAGKLFGGSFDHVMGWHQNPIIDASDRVRRCPLCLWELEEGWCYNCDHDFGDMWSDEDDSDGSIHAEEDHDSTLGHAVIRIGSSPTFRHRHRPERAADSHARGLDSTDSEEDHDTDLDGFIDDDMPGEEEDDDSDDSVELGRYRSHGHASRNIRPNEDSGAPIRSMYSPSPEYHVLDDSDDEPPQLTRARRQADRYHHARATIESSDDSTDDVSDPQRLSENSANDDHGHYNDEHSLESDSLDHESDDTAAPITSASPSTRPSRKRRRVVEDDSDDADLGNPEGASLLSASPGTSPRPRARSESILTASAENDPNSGGAYSSSNRIQPICLDGSSDAAGGDQQPGHPRRASRSQRPQRAGHNLPPSRSARSLRSRRS